MSCIPKELDVEDYPFCNDCKGCKGLECVDCEFWDNRLGCGLRSCDFKYSVKNTN